MLVSLSIRDIVLIDKLDLEFARGLTILTGETGAGKSILLDGLSSALGARGEAGLVRNGAAHGQVSAAFELSPDHPAIAAANAQGIAADGTLILRRQQLADGRSRAFVNDQRVTAQSLRAIACKLVEIHGQHDDRALVDSGTHRALVDAFGSLSGMAGEVREAFQRLRDLSAEVQREEARLGAARGEAGYLRHAVDELTGLAAKPGEESALAERRSSLMQAEKIATELFEAHAAVAGDHSPMPALSAALRRLERRQSQAPSLITPAAEALASALNALGIAAQALDQAVREASFEPRALERIEERLFALRAASRKYAAPADELAALAEKFAAALAALDSEESRLQKLKREAADAAAAYGSKARALSLARKNAASQLDAAVAAELAPLKLEGAVFTTAFATGPEGPEGFDQVEFWVRTNPGTNPGPLMKIASGGELARFLLALKVVLADRGSAPTLVFDEIDAGAGGAVADAIGQRLARLSSHVQVLAVTHAPQVAARANGHLRIVKAPTGDGGTVATRVAALGKEGRCEEIARMLAGATITDEARAAAARLLASGR
jgi:DNA repair protein RecN (Recombination protein N)